MKNKSTVRIVAVIVGAVIVITAAFFTYCFLNSKNKEAENRDDSTLTKYTADETKDETTEYGISYIDVPNDMNDGGRIYFCIDNKLVHLKNMTEDENGVRDNFVTVYDIGEGTFTKFDLDFSEITSNEVVVAGFAPYMEDEYVAFVYDTSGQLDDGQYRSYIAILDEDFTIERYGETAYGWCSCHISADRNGYIAIGGDNGENDDYPIRIYDSEFNLVMTEPSPDGNIYEFVSTVNGKIAIGFIYDAYDCYLSIYNSDTNDMDSSIIPILGHGYSVEYGDDTIAFIKNESEIYTYGVGDDYITKVIDFTQYGIEVSRIYPIISSGGDTFFYPIMGTDDETRETVLTQWAVISKDAAYDDRQELTYAVTGSYPTKAVSDFNRESTEYFIKVVDYSDEDGLERLEKEIVSGNIPDILDCSDIDVEAYVEKGVLSEVSDVAESVGILDVFKSAMEVGGGLYDLPYEYQIGYISGKTSFLPNTTEYTADEIRDIIEENDISYFAESMLGYDFVLGMIRGNEEYYLTSGNNVFSEGEFVSILSLIKDYGFSNNSFNASVDQLVTLSFEEGDYLFSYGLVVNYATVGEIRGNSSEYFATGVTLGGETNPALLLTATFGMTTSCQSAEAFSEFVEMVYDEELTTLPLTDDQLAYIENVEDMSGETLEFIEKAAENGIQRNYCGYSSIIEDEIERMIDQNIDPSKIASEIQEKMSIYINEQGE